MSQSWIFLKNIPIGQKWPKMVKNGQGGQNGQNFKKVTSLVLFGICVKWKFLWFINILQKLDAWEKSGSQIIAKNGFRPIRFQYSLIVSISLIRDFSKHFLLPLFGRKNLIFNWVLKLNPPSCFISLPHISFQLLRFSF